MRYALYGTLRCNNLSETQARDMNSKTRFSMIVNFNYSSCDTDAYRRYSEIFHHSGKHESRIRATE